jgi:acyl-CoA thioesterase FadM
MFCALLLFLQLHERVVRLPRTAEEEDVVVAESMTTVVSLNQDYKPTPWPASARKLLKKALEGTVTQPAPAAV